MILFYFKTPQRKIYIRDNFKMFINLLDKDITQYIGTYYIYI